MSQSDPEFHWQTFAPNLQLGPSSAWRSLTANLLVLKDLAKLLWYPVGATWCLDGFLGAQTNRKHHREGHIERVQKEATLKHWQAPFSGVHISREVLGLFCANHLVSLNNYQTQTNCEAALISEVETIL